MDSNNNTLHFDGASKGNPGPSGGGIHLVYEGKEILNNELYGIGTNNEAEWKALLFGLKTAIDHNIKQLDVYGDSMLVINQINGDWQIKKEIFKNFNSTAKEYITKIPNITFTWIPREDNTKADEQANIGLHSTLTFDTSSFQDRKRWADECCDGYDI